ncbi:glycosyltransferase family 2 protein [Candidatus Aenigmatarchaeota archaeon]
MKATIGIITHNRHDMISICLKSISKQTTKPEKIIIVDTSDNDKTKHAIKKSKLRIKYIHLKKRVKQPEARNIILKNTTTDIIAFLDDDTSLKKKWLEKIVEGYSYSDDIVGVCGPAINSDLKLRALEETISTDKNQNFFKSTGDVRDKSRKWIPTKPVKCQVMLGANMSYLTKKIKAVGGFVSFYKEGYGFREENFPQVKMIRKGGNFLYHPEAFVWHIKTRSGGAEFYLDHYYLCGKNHKIFADKLFSKWKSRASWIFWSVSPPCLWITFALAIKRRNRNILRWHKGLWLS